MKFNYSNEKFMGYTSMKASRLHARQVYWNLEERRTQSTGRQPFNSNLAMILEFSCTISAIRRTDWPLEHLNQAEIKK